MGLYYESCTGKLETIPISTNASGIAVFNNIRLVNGDNGKCYLAWRVAGLLLFAPPGPKEKVNPATIKEGEFLMINQIKIDFNVLSLLEDIVTLFPVASLSLIASALNHRRRPKTKTKWIIAFGFFFLSTLFFGT